MLYMGGFVIGAGSSTQLRTSAADMSVFTKVKHCDTQLWVRAPRPFVVTRLTQPSTLRGTIK